MSIKLLDWQKEVVFGNQRSLAAPAGARTGKNIATVFAMKERPTLTVVPSMRHVKNMQSELSHYGCAENGKVYSRQEFFDSLKLSCGFLNGLNKYDQIIFNELYGIELIPLLQLRDMYEGKIVVMGVPMGIPCPIFYPLSKVSEWVFLDKQFQIEVYGDHEEIINSLRGRCYRKDVVLREIDAVWA